MWVRVVRNNPNFPGMERLDGLFVYMRKSHPVRASFTRFTPVAWLVRNLFRRCFSNLYIISISSLSISRKIWKCYPRKKWDQQVILGLWTSWCGTSQTQAPRRHDPRSFHEKAPAGNDDRRFQQSKVLLHFSK